MAGIDKKTQESIALLIESTLRQMYEAEEEKWLSSEQLIAQFGCFSKGWLKAYGHLLPRTQAIVTDKDGAEHRSGWCYPQHRIQRMINDGSITTLKI